MAETQLKVTLIGHTKLTGSFVSENDLMEEYINEKFTDSQAVALTAIRTCYSPLKPSEIVATEGEKYFGNAATDGEGGTEADRLFRHITRSGHTSTLEHLSYTFAIEGVSRALLAQLTRHRVGFSFSVQSQRYVRLGSNDKSGGFDFITPPSIEGSQDAKQIFVSAMVTLQAFYDGLRAAGVPAEDARMILPNAAATNLTMTTNLTALLGFYKKRKPGRGAQFEIAQLAEQLKNAVIAVNPWTEAYFEAV
jgi:thymidylate synthase (FAD)